MGRVKLGLVLFVMVLLVSLCGCATTGGRKDDAQSLRNQVIALESQLQQKDAEIDSLRRALSQTTEEKYGAAKAIEQQRTIAKPTIKQIQVALKNAGFDPGPIDGKMGKATRNAIKEFQKTNSLTVDGQVGKKTWSALEPYLNKSSS